MSTFRTYDQHTNDTASKNAAAFFDLDRTLIESSSTFTVAIEAHRSGLLPLHHFVTAAAVATAFKVLGAGDGTSQIIRQRVLDAVAGTQQADLEALNIVVLPKLLQQIRPEANEQLEAHQQAGIPTYIISAAPQEIVGPLAARLGMTGGIGTRSIVRNGRYTGDLDGSFCYGPAKRAAIEELAAQHGYDLTASFAYSDSISDLPMLNAVGHPVAVNPDSKLRSHSRAAQWPVITFQRTSTATHMFRLAVAATACIAFKAACSRRRTLPPRLTRPSLTTKQKQPQGQ